jgi:hypothetical protein
MSTSRRTVRVIALAAAVCVALAVMASLTVAKGGLKAKLIGPVNQPPLSLGQATVELKVAFRHKGKKLVPKSFEGKERNLYIHCADGTDGYPTDGGAGDAITGSHIEIESTVFVKKNGTFNHTDTSRGDVDSGTFNIQGKFHGRSASGTLRMENHRNDGSSPSNDDLTCDSGVLSWTASAP